MKEFYITLDTENINGLRHSDNFPRNGGKLYQSLNAIPTEYGLEAYENIINPIIDCPILSWPFPQIHLGKVHQLLMTQDKIYSIDADWELTLELDMSSYYTSNPTHEYSIWHFGDFYDYIVITNNHLVVVYNTTTGIFELHSATANMPEFTTIANFNGQAVCGNITTPWHGAEDNHIIWSKIGDMDFLPDGMNTSGIYPTPWLGGVLKVLPLANGVVVYCESGIMFMEPVEQYWSFVILTNYGIAGRGAVDGDDYTHIFIDTEGYIRKLTSNKQISKLGFQEYIQPLIDNEVVVNFIESKNWFSISDNETSYILTVAGLGKSSQVITSAISYDGSIIGIVSGPINLDYIITTHLVDMKFKGIKTLSMIEFGLDTDADAFVGIDYRFDKSKDFTSTGWTRLNKEGIAYMSVAGIEFRIRMKCETYTEVNLDYINVRFKTTDKRFIRGTYNAS